MIRKTVERDGILKTFDDMGGTVLANVDLALGNGRASNDQIETQSLHRLIAILLSESNTHSFVASPEINGHGIGGR